MKRESLKLFKEYAEAAIVEKRRALSDKILLVGTSDVFVNAGRYLTFASQKQEFFYFLFIYFFFNFFFFI